MDVDGCGEHRIYGEEGSDNGRFSETKFGKWIGILSVVVNGMRDFVEGWRKWKMVK